MGEDVLDSPAAWRRLAICMALSTIGSVSMWSVVVALPAIQASFGVDRGAASFSYTATMLGFALGSVLTGRWSDRQGIFRPALAGSAILACGYVAAGLSGSLGQLALIHFALIGALGGAFTFGPLMTHVSFWFARRRGLAMAMCASGNYLAGTIWPPILQHFIAQDGWRATYVGVGLFCAAAMLPLVFLLRGPVPSGSAAPRPAAHAQPIDLPPALLQSLLVLASFACCVAMATPQVHLVAYCADLGYGPARGAEMLSLMFACGIASRIGSGWLADRIGGPRTLLLGSVLQGLALMLYIGFDSLASLYLVSALFGLFQGGIVPSYAVVIRESFPARQAGARFGLVLMASTTGMAAGGWLAGAVDDWTGSYRASFAAGLLWNALNTAIVLVLLLRRTSSRAPSLNNSATLA